MGEQQRVMLARALALEPEVLLLDEPTSALDERTQAGVEATLARLVSELGVSTVIVTHDRGQAQRLARRTVTARAGMSAADVTLGEVAASLVLVGDRGGGVALAARRARVRTSAWRCCARSSSSPRSAT